MLPSDSFTTSRILAHILLVEIRKVKKMAATFLASEGQIQVFL